jgi:predicted acylesterase/phospholipase RssA
VLDGGVFNGSYHVGALYFLKEMERRNYIKINRISGCSVGSIVAFLYYIDSLDLMPKLYEIINEEYANLMGMREKLRNQLFKNRTDLSIKITLPMNIERVIEEMKAIGKFDGTVTIVFSALDELEKRES